MVHARLLLLPQVPLDIANPAPLGEPVFAALACSLPSRRWHDLGPNNQSAGFMAFALTTGLYMTSQAGLTESATQFLAFPLGITFGGLTMITVAFVEVLRRYGAV